MTILVKGHRIRSHRKCRLPSVNHAKCIHPKLAAQLCVLRNHLGSQPLARRAIPKHSSKARDVLENPCQQQISLSLYTAHGMLWSKTYTLLFRTYSFSMVTVRCFTLSLLLGCIPVCLDINSRFTCTYPTCSNYGFYFPSRPLSVPQNNLIA